MNRPLLFLERILYGDGTEPFNGVFVLRLKGTVDINSLRNALDKVQAKHPALSTSVRFQRGKPWFYFPKKNDKIGLTVSGRNSDTHWQQAVKSAWNLHFDGALLQVNLLKGEACSELILAFHHCICDGGGGLILVRDILMLLDEPEQEIGSEKAGGLLEDIIPAEVLRNPRRKIRIRLTGLLLRTVLKTSALFIKPDNSRRFLREEDYLLHRKFSKAASDAWFKKCSAHQVTVNTAVSTALLLSFKKIIGKDAHNKLSCPVDIRRFIQMEDRNSLFSFGLILTMQADKKAAGDFWQLARAVQVKADRQMKKLNPYDFLMLMETLHPATQPMLKTLTYGKVSNDLMFSNLGRLDIPDRYTNFEVDTVFSPTVIGPFGNPTTVIASTYKGQLDLCFVSNQKYLTIEKGEKILQEALSLMEEENTSN